MGKATGFMEYERTGNPATSPLKRTHNYKEFHTPLTLNDRRRQAARCMDCGVPFCQAGVNLCGAGFSGCPLHNLIPEWNDMIYKGNYGHAVARLLKTSNFPEFTSRVCPALCEAGCTCGLHDSPVTVKENEYFLIEYAFEHGLMKPRVPHERTGKKVAVVGSGPSGLAVADQLNHRGHSVCVFERADRIGGLLMYGIPNMKLEKHIVQRRVDLMEAEGVTFIANTDVGKTVSAKTLLQDFDAVVLCCGATRPRDLSAPGREANGIYFAVDFLKANTKSLLDSDLKDGHAISAEDKHVVIVGGGDTGNDCIGTAMRHGCASVTALEMMPKPPEERTASNPWPEWPRVYKVDYGHEEAAAKFGHDPRLFQTTVSSFNANEDGVLTSLTIVDLDTERDEATGHLNMVPHAGSERDIPCNLLLIAAGFLGPEAYVPEAFGLELTPRSTVATAQDTYATNVRGVFTAGDMHRGQSLVVWGVAEGRGAAREVDAYLMGYSALR